MNMHQGKPKTSSASAYRHQGNAVLDRIAWTCFVAATCVVVRQFYYLYANVQNIREHLPLKDGQHGRLFVVVILIAGFALLYFCIAATQLVAGLGILARRRWAWVLALISAGLSCIIAGEIFILSAIALIARLLASALDPNLAQSFNIIKLTVDLICLVSVVVHAFATLAVLPRRKYSQELG